MSAPTAPQEGQSIVGVMYHYTDQAGYNAVRAMVDWCFKAAQPLPPDHPFGAYFTTLSPETPNLAQRLRIPASKMEFYFSFADAGDLIPLRGGRGKYIYYSPVDYTVNKERQGAFGETGS